MWAWPLFDVRLALAEDAQASSAFTFNSSICLWSWALRRKVAFLPGIPAPGLHWALPAPSWDLHGSLEWLTLLHEA